MIIISTLIDQFSKNFFPFYSPWVALNLVLIIFFQNLARRLFIALLISFNLIAPEACTWPDRQTDNQLVGLHCLPCKCRTSVFTKSYFILLLEDPHENCTGDHTNQGSSILNKKGKKITAVLKRKRRCLEFIVIQLPG